MFVEADNYPILIHCIHGKDRTGRSTPLRADALRPPRRFFATSFTLPNLLRSVRHFGHQPSSTGPAPHLRLCGFFCPWCSLCSGASGTPACSLQEQARRGSDRRVRVGIVVMLLLLLCGVKREAIVEDYMMSEKVLKQSRMHNELDLDGAPPPPFPSVTEAQDEHR